MLGPLANYAFLRYYGGDKENESSQTERYKKHDALKYQELEQWKVEKNSVWPDIREFVNPWALGSFAFGTVLAFAEEVVKGWYEF